MSDAIQEMAEIRRRVEDLESKMSYLFRSLGIQSGEAPAGKASPEIMEMVRSGKKIEAIRAYREETGASLKDAKSFIESLEPGISSRPIE